MRPSYDLEACLDRGSIALQKQEGRCPVRLSSSLDCARKIALRALKTHERPLDPEGARIFRTGHDRGASHVEALKALVGDKLDHPAVWAAEHETWLSVPMDNELALRAEQVLWERFGSTDCSFVAEGSPVPKVRGRIDVALKHQGRYTIGDFKTVAEYGFEKVDPDDWKTVNETYLGQLGAYCKAFIETENLDALTDPCVIYEHKDTSRMKVVWVPLATALEYGQAAQKNLAAVLTAIAQGKEASVPPAFGPDSKGKLPWNCRYCEVVETCWAGKGLRIVTPEPRTFMKRITTTPKMPDYFIGGGS